MRLRATCTETAIYHLFDPDYVWNNGTRQEIYLQEGGLGGAYTDISDGTTGRYGQATTVPDTFHNLAYDGKWYTIINGNLYRSTDLVGTGGTFTNLGNAQVGGGVDNLAYDNGVFYHFYISGSTVQLWSSTNPVSFGWSKLTDTSLLPTQADGLAVHDGVFYAIDSNNGWNIPRLPI
ncbi:MAG: hypothetical protein R3E95_03845 [Thiolinea sp.]